MMTMTFHGNDQDQMALGQNDSQPPKNKVGGGCIGILFGGVFMLIGVSMGISAYSNWRALADIESWPPVEGIIESTGINIDSEDDDYTPYAIYSYSVEGQSYTSDKITYYSKAYASRDEAQAVLDRYPIRTEVMVYYDPDKHSRAVLDRTPQGDTAIWLIVGGAIFAVAGLVFALVSRLF